MWSVVAFQPAWKMAREPSISKYWVSWTSAAPGSSKVGTRLEPSTGCWVTPSTTSGGSIPTASSTVGSRSTTWVKAERTSPVRSTRRGQWTTSGVRVPPSQV